MWSNDVVCVHIEVIKKARAHDHKYRAGSIHATAYVFGFAKEYTDPARYECYEWYAYVKEVDIIGSEHNCLAFGLLADKDPSINIYVVRVNRPSIVERSICGSTQLRTQYCVMCFYFV